MASEASTAAGVVDADQVTTRLMQVGLMRAAYRLGGGNVDDAEDLSRALVMAAITTREQAFGGLTKLDADWLRLFADAIDRLDGPLGTKQ
jgi:hypothetical protein